MKQILTLSILYIFSFLSCTAMSNDKPLRSTYNLSDFEEVSIDSLSENDLRKLNHSTHQFMVEFENGELLINKASYNGLSELNIDGGKLLGIDRGEWGGELLFQSDTSKVDKIKIKDGNIASIFRFQDQIYFLEGLAHLSISEGALYRLNVVNKKFSYEKIFDFEDAAMAVTTLGDRIFIVSFGSLYIINSGSKESIFEDTFWQMLYPNSITCADQDTLYIGIRGGIVKVDISKKKLSFYRYKD